MGEYYLCEKLRSAASAGTYLPGNPRFRPAVWNNPKGLACLLPRTLCGPLHWCQWSTGVENPVLMISCRTCRVALDCDCFIQRIFSAASSLKFSCTSHLSPPYLCLFHLDYMFLEQVVSHRYVHGA